MKLYPDFKAARQDNVTPGELVRVSHGAVLLVGIVTPPAREGGHHGVVHLTPGNNMSYQEHQLPSSASFISFGRDWLLAPVFDAGGGRSDSNAMEHGGTLSVGAAPALTIITAFDGARLLSLQDFTIGDITDYTVPVFTAWSIWTSAESRKAGDDPIITKALGPPPIA